MKDKIKNYWITLLNDSDLGQVKFWLLISIFNKKNNLDKIVDDPCKTIMDKEIDIFQIRLLLNQLEKRRYILMNVDQSYSLSPEAKLNANYLLKEINEEIESDETIEDILMSMRRNDINTNSANTILKIKQIQRGEDVHYNLIIELILGDAIPFIMWITELLTDM